jgi:hypothetical protein
LLPPKVKSTPRFGLGWEFDNIKYDNGKANGKANGKSNGKIKWKRIRIRNVLQLLNSVQLEISQDKT